MGGGATRIGGLEVRQNHVFFMVWRLPRPGNRVKLRVLEASGLLECSFTTCLSTSWPWNAVLRQVFADSASREPSRLTTF